MGLLLKPKTVDMPASAQVRFYADRSASTSFEGEYEYLVHSPAIYLDWAVNKDRKKHALAFLAAVENYMSEISAPGERHAFPEFAPLACEWRSTDDAPTSADVEVTIAFTLIMRCKPAFRPRRAIARFLYPTFWALWNEVQLSVEEDVGESLVENLAYQLEWYSAHGVGMRGGIAHLHASMAGASDRLAQEIAELAGMTVEEFRGLPVEERDAIIAAHSQARPGDAVDDEE